ncbi:hypothetical protein V8E54_008235 [Elaphomyces granulatus]
MLYQLMEMVEQQNSTPESEFQIQCIYVSSDKLSGWAGGRRLEANSVTFFSFISSKIFEETMIVGTGTFGLSRWNWAGSLRPMAPITTQTNGHPSEANKIYDKRIEPIPDDLRPLIYREANGHATSIMPLLRFVHEEHPTIDNWDIMLEAKYASHMNGFRRKINAEVDKREDSIFMKREDLQDPIDLLCRALTGPDYGIKGSRQARAFRKHLPPRTITALRDLVPMNWLCSPEVHEASGSNKRLDLLIAELLLLSDPRKESYVNWTGYKLKVDKVLSKDFDES